MKNVNISTLSDEEVLKEYKELKSFSFINALFIGFLIGIILFSLFNNALGFLTLILLYFIHKFINDPKNKRLKEIEAELVNRKLKV